MSDFLNGIRRREKSVPAAVQIVNTVGILLFGVVLGVFSKFGLHGIKRIAGSHRISGCP